MPGNHSPIQLPTPGPAAEGTEGGAHERRVSASVYRYTLHNGQAVEPASVFTMATERKCGRGTQENFIQPQRRRQACHFSGK